MNARRLVRPTCIRLPPGELQLSASSPLDHPASDDPSAQEISRHGCPEKRAVKARPERNYRRVSLDAKPPQLRGSWPIDETPTAMSRRSLQKCSSHSCDCWLR